MNANAKPKQGYLSPNSREAYAAYLAYDEAGNSPIPRALVMPRHLSKIVARLVFRADRSEFQSVVWC
jgi:hypothetical protein